MSDVPAGITLTPEVVAEWPEEHRPDDPSSVELGVRHNPILGPMITAAIEEKNILFTIMTSLGLGALFPMNEKGEAIGPPLVEPYPLSEAAEQSLFAQAV